MDPTAPSFIRFSTETSIFPPTDASLLYESDAVCLFTICSHGDFPLTFKQKPDYKPKGFT